MWCVGDLTEEYRERMYGLLDLYAKKYDPEEPVICIDEKSKQLLSEKREPIKGKEEKIDYEYVREGTRNIFVAVEPLGGFRHVEVTLTRTRSDFAAFVKETKEKYPLAKKFHFVLDNLNTHFAKSFYVAFEKEEAEKILSNIEFHYTPKHASWLNAAEIEIGIMDRQCLDRRIPTEEKMKSELAAWEKLRNDAAAKITWTFTREQADMKLQNHYV